jgi:outer membrane protein assembly factor BamB
VTAFLPPARRDSFRRKALAASCGFFLLLPAQSPADWLHYRGPQLEGISEEKLPELVAGKSLSPAWKSQLGTGTSSITVAGNRVYSMGNEGNQDIVRCLDAKTGKELWRHSYPQDLDRRMFEGGTAATPTVDGNKLYTVSHQGDLFCLDALTGKPLWHRNYLKDFAGRRPEWGYSGSPTVDGNLLLLDVGGIGASTVALNKDTGETLWKSGDDAAGYGCVKPATLEGKRTALVFKAQAIVGLDAKDGRELWRLPWKTNYDVNAITPLVFGDKIFVSSGYGTGSALLSVSGGKVTELWRNKSLRAHFNTPVFWQGHIYGFDGQADSRGALVCLDAATGTLQWSDKSFRCGSLILAEDKLIALSERGELIIGKATPTGFKPLLQSPVLGGRCWVQPAYSGGRIFARNNQGDLVCVDLSTQ